MNLEEKLKDLEIALKQAGWFSTAEHVDYDVDLSIGVLFINGTIAFFNDTVLEFTESVTPERRRYRYQYMRTDNTLIFRYDNVPHHRQLATFPHHKHDGDKVIASEAVELRQVIEEIIDLIVTA